ncbi:hypothetical protein [Pseudoroseomonas ludipueritiae]|uniref:Uncharacterized protein n=1 Tax=Pseudoroseomonas ludipueritiae TaxID=198093 RepID=A0ABR7R9S9_9PROT|nr:hypothetical protein [Pseudoroseomonas ludipueritiae]MBC9178571.1 hypothetical protein [Pseudoroseomonas ludipueritiae]MCG7363191.1 hypothetical protein [Roseomonas sp. ACRSG]
MKGAQFNRALRLAIERDLAPTEVARQFVAMAKADVQRRIAIGEVPRQFARFVDGRKGAGDDAVQPDSVILYRFNPLAEAAKLALQELWRRSPVATGAYRQSFYLGISRGGDSGRFIKAANFSPRTMSADATEIVIGNEQPYSRRVDVQRDGTVPLKFSVDPNLFAETAALVRRRFPTVNAKGVYTMLFPGQYRLKTGPRAGRPVHSPAIVISIRE